MLSHPSLIKKTLRCSIFHHQPWAPLFIYIFQNFSCFQGVKNMFFQCQLTCSGSAISFLSFPGDVHAAAVGRRCQGHGGWGHPCWEQCLGQPTEEWQSWGHGVVWFQNGWNQNRNMMEFPWDCLLYVIGWIFACCDSFFFSFVSWHPIVLLWDLADRFSSHFAGCFRCSDRLRSLRQGHHGVCDQEGQGWEPSVTKDGWSQRVLSFEETSISNKKAYKAKLEKAQNLIVLEKCLVIFDFNFKNMGYRNQTLFPETKF